MICGDQGLLAGFDLDGAVAVLLTTYMACPGIRRMRILRGAPNPASRSQLYNRACVFTYDPELR